MACGGCSSGRGCSTATSGKTGESGAASSCSTGGCNKMNVFDWLSDMSLPPGQKPFDVVEVRFKNNRKEFFRNVNELPLAMGDVIAVESSPGHDIGTVSLSGELVKNQLKRKNVNAADPAMKKVYRKAKQNDIDKWMEAQSHEKGTLVKAREFAIRLGLQMKIGDVEFQGDKTKAIFYYTADDRVDFRELIKVMAEDFRVRIEMRQIGARQEAARLGGIGSCGRELCCSTWLTDFRSVTTSAARYQQLSLNPLKLAGQCGKLKCCLNYELDSYLDALKDFPEATDIETIRGRARHQKTDIFKGVMYYTFFDEPDQFIPVPNFRAKELIEMNRRGEKPDVLIEKVKEEKVAVKAPDFENVVGQDSLTRFDKQKSGNKKRKKGKGGRGPGGDQPQGQQNKSAGQNPNRPPQQQGPRQQGPKPQQNRPPQNKGPQQNKPQGPNPNRPPQQGPKPPNQNRPPQNKSGLNPNQRNPNNQNRNQNRGPKPGGNNNPPSPPSQ
jgi:cell fate regulator YaaT (PSP1 superfamily)